MIIDCPNCFNRIIPKSDNTCPSCGINLSVCKKSNLAKLEINEKDKLPDICFICGDKDHTTFTFTHNETLKNIFRILLTIFKGLFIFGGGRLALSRKNFEAFSFNIKDNIKLKLPVCNLCYKSKKINPEYININKSTMTFIVHKKFKEQFKLLQ